jgi:hypothetical protein
MATTSLYAVHDNGSRPFLVDLDFPKAHIYYQLFGQDSKIDYQPLFSISNEKAFVGWDPVSFCDALGNSVLLKLDLVISCNLIQKEAAEQN